MTAVTSSRVLIPARPHRWSGTFTLLLVSVVLVTGCGGGNSSSFKREDVEASMTAVVRKTLPEGALMNRLKCVQDGDDQHWQCIADVVTTDFSDSATNHIENGRLVVEITCDPDTRQCISRPL